MALDFTEQPKDRLSVIDAIEAGVIISVVPGILAFLASLLPLDHLAANLPTPLRSYLLDPKNVGALVYAIGILIAWPIVRRRQRLKRFGYHPRGKYQPGKINIWVAELEGDTSDHKARTRMMASLSDLFDGSVEVLCADIAPRPVDTGIAGQEAVQGNRTAREYLEKNQGEVILWGEYFNEPAPLMELHLVSAGQDGKQAVPFEYDPGTNRPVAKKFRPYFSAALAALVVTIAQRSEEDEGKYVADVLRPLAEKIGVLVRHLPIELGNIERARIYHGLGDLYGIVGYQDDSTKKLRSALRMLLKARSYWKRVDGSDRQLAKTLQRLGEVCYRLGEKSKVTATLKLSIKVSELAKSMFAQETEFEEWARCTLDQASALYYLGDRLDRVFLEEAVVSCDAVLAMPGIKKFPKLHSRALDVSCCAQSNFGLLESNPGRIQASIKTAQELLTLWTRDATPLEWARTQMNIAIHFERLWIIDNKKESLDAAWNACSLALKIFSPTCKPAYYGKTIQTMGNILYNERQWKDAADRYQEALKVLNPDTDEYEYLEATKGLRQALEEMRRPWTVVAEKLPS